MSKKIVLEHGNAVALGTLKNRAKIEKKMQENYEKLYVSFGNVVQMVLPIIHNLQKNTKKHY